MKYIKRLFIPFVLVVGLVIVVERLTEFEKIITLARQGSWIAIIISLFFATLVPYLSAELIQIIYSSFNIHEKLKHLMIVILAANFANFVLPTVGFSGVTLFVTDAKTRKIELGSALTTILLYYFLYYGIFSIVLVATLTYLFFSVGLSSYQAIASIIFLLIVFIFGNFLYHSAHSKRRSVRMMMFLVSFANTTYRFLRQKKFLSQTTIESVAQSMNDHLTRLKNNRVKLILPVLYGFALHAVNLLVIAFLFVAFSYPVPVTTIIIGFSMAVLFSLVSITPSGVGFVEGAMVLAFKSQGVDLDIALVITLIYRGLVFWLPFFIGLPALRRIQQHINEFNQRSIDY